MRQEYLSIASLFLLFGLLFFAYGHIVDTGRQQLAASGVPVLSDPHAAGLAATTPLAPAPAQSPTLPSPLTNGHTVVSKSVAVEPNNTPPAPTTTPLYRYPASSFEQVNTATRAALVNIFCTPGGNIFNPISGSGVIIDPRGIILTNAHVAQYVLLADSGKIDLSCSARSGAPATTHYGVYALYLPSTWVAAHASEIARGQTTSTGEHDWALLGITRMSQSPSPLPFISPDTRPAELFAGISVLAAGYPAEFLGGIMAQTNLYPASSFTTVGQFLTFTTSTVDIFSLGGIIEAQSGSSGGPVVNLWGKLIGIITTTSGGATTAERDLHAITTNYIDRDLASLTGRHLDEILSESLDELRARFATESLPSLSQTLLQGIAK